MVSKIDEIKIGQIIVIICNDAQTDLYKESIVFYINDLFPLSHFNNAIKSGHYQAREATDIEKEYCFWCYEQTNKEGANLSGLDFYIKWKGGDKNIKWKK